MKAISLILLWLFLVATGVLVSSWWIQKKQVHSSTVDFRKHSELITVSVGGEVESPRVVQVPKGTTLGEIISIAGGRRVWGTARLVRYHLGGEMWTFNIEKSGHGSLGDQSKVVVPSKSYWEEWRPEYYPIYGKKHVPLAELQNVLSQAIGENWGLNFWGGIQGIEYRAPSGQHAYTCIIRPPTEKEILQYQPDAPPGEELRFSISVRPFTSQEFSQTTEKILSVTQSLVLGKETISVTIGGEISKPQLLKLPIGSTLGTALRRARNPTKHAATNRIKVYQNGHVYTVNQRKKADLNLGDNSLIVLPVLKLTEWPDSEIHHISGTKKLNLDQIQKLLESRISGTFVRNYWGRDVNLDLRMGDNNSYRCLSIDAAKPTKPMDGGTAISEQTKFTYTITARPSRSHQGPGQDVLRVIEALKAAVNIETGK